ncbi:MAG: hypothetical protein AAF604_04620 [Acidobacteriota bacterium]
MSADGCTVLGGTFPDDYSRSVVLAVTFADVDIDHRYSARAMWDRYCETHGKPPSRRLWRRMYEDRRNLAISSASTNRSKGDRGPHEWCPSSPSARRRAAAPYRAQAERYGLSINDQEEAGLRAWERGECLAEEVP